MKYLNDTIGNRTRDLPPFGQIRHQIHWTDNLVLNLTDIIRSPVNDIKERGDCSRCSEWATGLDNPRFEFWHGKGLYRLPEVSRQALGTLSPG